MTQIKGVFPQENYLGMLADKAFFHRAVTTKEPKAPYVITGKPATAKTERGKLRPSFLDELP